MWKLIVHFLREQAGQDLVEYSLLMAFLALASAALFVGISDDIGTIWDGISKRLADPN